MAETRNPREVVDIGKFQPYTHPQYGAGAIREVTYIDGTIERRFFYHGTQQEGEGAPDSGYLVDTKVDPELRDRYERNRPPAETRAPQRTPEQQIADAAAASKAQEDERERAYHRAMGHGNLTHKEYQDHLDKRAAEARAQESQARADKNQERLTAAQEAQTQIQRERLQFDRDKANLPEVKQESVERNGVRYTQVTRTTPQGETTVTYLGPDGKPVPSLPNTAPDNPSVPGPKMPQIVLGASQQALQQYKAELQAGVASGLWSQKWANERWSEALDQARIAVQEASTAQAERESTRAAEINLAQGRATLGQNALSTALDHVNKINGLLPEGSSLGGQTFAALLGLSMLNQARSGIDTIDPRGRPTQQQQAPVPTITPAEMRDPAAMATKRAEIMANPVFRPQAVATYPGPSQAPGEPPARAAIPSSPGAPSMTAPSVAAPPAAPAPAPAAPAERADDVLTVRGQDGSTHYMTRANWDASPPEGQALYTVVNAEPASARPGVQSTQTSEQYWNPPAPAQKQEPAAGPDFGAPGMRVLPQPPDGPLLPHEPGFTPAIPQVPAGGNVQMAPTPDLPALADYRRMTPMSAPAPSVTGSAAPMPDAVMQNRIASTPPWQLSEDDYRYALEHGLESQFWSPGGRVA